MLRVVSIICVNYESELERGGRALDGTGAPRQTPSGFVPGQRAMLTPGGCQVNSAFDKPWFAVDGMRFG